MNIFFTSIKYRTWFLKFLILIMAYSLWLYLGAALPLPIAFVEEEIQVGSSLLETPMGNLVADAIRFYSGTDAALIPNGYIGGGLPRGPLTRELIVRSLIYPDDTVVTAYLRGSELLQILEQSLSVFPFPNARFLQVSGMNIEFSDKTSKKGDAVFGKEGRLRKVLLGRKEIEPEATYKIAMIRPMAQGFLGYPPVGRDFTDTKVTLVQALETYAKTRQVLRYGIEGRVRLIP